MGKGKKGIHFPERFQMVNQIRMNIIDSDGVNKSENLQEKKMERK